MATSHTSEIRVLRRPVESTFRAAIAVDHAAGLQPSQRGGHVQDIDDEVSAVVVGHRVADHFAGGQVQP
ncbi:hypothetical protein ACFYN3_42145 [Streptomyces lavendulae]|uniref:hypothetical protein n=1 Tax=Streptomyces lavendulae TaxID=1914 RepID=UPI003673B074